MTLTGTTNPDKSKPGSNGNEGVLYTPQISRTGASINCHTQDTPTEGGEALTLFNMQNCL